MHLGASWLIPAGTVWAVVALIWLIFAWREPKGRNWHLVLAVTPLAAFALAIWGPQQLAPALALWLLMGGGVAAALCVAWMWGTAARNHGVMDVIYPLAVLAGVLVGVLSIGVDAWVLMMLAPIVVWSLRLAVQTYGHNMGSEREPYASWRKRFGAKWPWWSFFQIHLLQGVTVWIWVAPIAFALAAQVERPLWPLALGCFVWAVGFSLQWLADRQLAAFKRNKANRGKLLDTGVWSFVRHPNYLGEATMWWGFFAFSLAHPFGVATVFAPLFATWFMGYASAAPFKERHMSRTRPEAWVAYCQRTPRFLPWPRPREGTS